MKYHPQTHIPLRPNLGVLQIGIKSQEDSTFTYTEVSSSFEGLSDIGSPGVDGLPMMLEDPYVEAALQAPPSPDYDDMLPAEEQPLPAAVSPTADSPGYITNSDPKEDEEDPEKDLADYPADGRDDDDDDDELSDDDEDDYDDVEKDEEEEEEEEHLALVDSVPPLLVYCTTARISIPTQAPATFLSEADVDRLLAIRTLPPSPLTPLSSLLTQIPSPLLLVSSPLPVSPPPLPASPTHPLGYRAAMIRLRAKSPSTSHPLPLPPSGTPPILPIPLPTSSPPLLIPSTDRRVGIPEVCLLPQKRLCIALGPRYEGTPAATDVTELGQQMTDLVTTVRKDTDEIYVRLDNAHDDRSLMSAQLNMLRRDRRAHARTARLMKADVRLSREAWRRSMEASDTPRSEVMALRTTVLENGTKKNHEVNTTQLKAMIDQGVTVALAARDANRSMNGTEGVVELTQWFKRMEIMFRISKCTVENQIKFATCTLLGIALLWWNSHVRTVGHDVMYAMTWTDLKKKMTDKMFPEDSDKIEKYVGGLPDMIHGSVMASRPKTM
ncbi:hypothetical protein Tco_0034261 [Tanacetum coccineum]